MLSKRVILFLAAVFAAVGAVACPEAGEIERSHAIGRTLLWAGAAWAVLWCGWMLWRRREQKPVGFWWIMALLIPLVNAVPVGLLNLSEMATDYNDSLMLDMALVGCLVVVLVDIIMLVGAFFYFLAPSPFPSNRQ